MLSRRRFTSDDFNQAIAPLFDHSSGLQREILGRSAEGRPLQLITCGTGPTSVLLWSQIHGDEPTGTMILADLLAWLANETSDSSRFLRSTLKLAMLPLLNPDGAAHFERGNGQGLDPDRDARAWVTPEARALRAVYGRTRPAFAIDLHDQDPRRLVGNSDRFVAWSLQAPKSSACAPADEARRRSQRLACVARDALAAHFEGHIARVPESYEPRGLAEYMQAHGTSVLVLNAAGWRGDLEKQQLRRGGFAALLDVLHAIADHSFLHIRPERYDEIPEQGKSVHDLLLLGGSIVRSGQTPFRADIAIDFQSPLDRRGGTIVELGDLADEHAFEQIDAHGLYIHHADEKVIAKAVRADLEVTRCADVGSELLYLIEDGRVLRRTEPQLATRELCREE